MKSKHQETPTMKSKHQDPTTTKALMAGDLCRLRSGGPIMVIDSVNPNRARAVVCWFNGCDGSEPSQHAFLQLGDVALAALKPIT
jgi:uncharacterized protein YodC (DUF2158 family)